MPGKRHRSVGGVLILIFGRPTKLCPEEIGDWKQMTGTRLIGIALRRNNLTSPF
jgi:hypothetical protein